ncbi:MAG TPA: type II TA system antitoxin MqsA family protein [Oscillospiraceae bacterium]|nr:type II TA system antitoxin MqsA family protein [Oscillospiraceae bacterium]
MIIIKTENKLCLSCMELHEVQTVICRELELFKNEEVSFEGQYEYCDRRDTLLEDDENINLNSLAMKNAYRKKMDLLTSDDIMSIRKIYDISQKDFAIVLDWGQATITRYENYQVQDRAHNDILLRVAKDPRWFLEMLERAKDKLSLKSYNKYRQNANDEFIEKANELLSDSIRARYAKYQDSDLCGGVNLDLEKVVEMINYLAQNIDSLYTVKLMKTLWYSDVLHYRREGRAISGLVYRKLPMGAVPDGYKQIIDLEGVKYDEEDFGDSTANRFRPSEEFVPRQLSETEIAALDTVISNFGRMNTNEIVHAMHNEEAYKLTEEKEIISYKHADKLSVT